MDPISAFALGMLAGQAPLHMQSDSQGRPAWPIIEWPDGSRICRVFGTVWSSDEASIEFEYIRPDGRSPLSILFDSYQGWDAPGEVVGLLHQHGHRLTTQIRQRLLWFIFDYLGLEFRPSHVSPTACDELALPTIIKASVWKRPLREELERWEALRRSPSPTIDQMFRAMADIANIVNTGIVHIEFDYGSHVWQYQAQPPSEKKVITLSRVVSSLQCTFTAGQHFTSDPFVGPLSLIELLEEHVVVVDRQAWVASRTFEAGRVLVDPDISEQYELLLDRPVVLVPNSLAKRLSGASSS